MYTCPLQISDVRYNAATQAFEAAVTVHDNASVRHYACAIPAPISMSFEDAARGLAKQAIRRHQSRGGLFSEHGRPAARQRAGRPGMNAVQWLQSLVTRPERAAA